MRIALILILVLPVALHAQFTYVIDQSIPVTGVDGQALAMPWGGGLNAAQYNTMDLNNDAKDDLVLFDRMANKVVTYLNENNQWRYAPQYERYFPADVTNWILLRDFNCDGKKDLFTGDVLGIKVYTNITVGGNLPAWQQFFFYDGAGSTPSPVLLTKGFTSKINLQIQYDDLPSISDMDGDGDLDILNIRFASNGTVEYHQNFSKELYGTCDSLAFERITQRWGGVTECTCGNFAFNNEACPPPGGGRVEHAGGKSLLALDSDGDGDQDLIFSESSCTSLFELINDGTNTAPLISSATVFPISRPVNLLIFPAAFYEDVDFDGRKDLVSTPNVYGKDYQNADLSSSNWFFKNDGSDAIPQFSFVKKNLLQEDMIDVGDNAVPAFGDIDGDGDYDMLISRNGSENYFATVYHYKNTGTPAVPSFTLVSDDFIGMSSLSLYNIKLQLVDVTGDNKPDAVFTATSFQTAITTLYYVANKGNGAYDFSDQTLQSTGFTVGRNENVHVTDVNADGLMDLLVGKSNGALEYWKNDGPFGEFNFSREDDSFLDLQVTVLRQSPMCATADLDADGKTDLVIGDQSGIIKIISNYRQAQDASGERTEIIFNPLESGYAPQNMGGRSWPAIVNLFNSTRPAIVVGNILGGVQVLRNDNGESLPEEPVVVIYPNPVAQNEVLHVKIDRQATLQLFSVLGQRVSDPLLVQPNEELLVSLSTLARGIYLVRLTSLNKTITKRIVVR